MNLYLFNSILLRLRRIGIYFNLFCWLISLSATVQATVIAKFDFETSGLSGNVLDQGSQSEVDFTTSALTDNATGTGAMSQSNSHHYNRKRISSSSWVLGFSSNRENDAQTPVASGGNNESTWVSFTVTASNGKVFDFSNQSATVDTFVSSTITGTTSANWTLYYSLDGGNSYSSLETLAGASRSGSGSAGPKKLTWSLSPIGNGVERVDFILDPTTTGFLANGVFDQRGTSFDNLTVNANINDPVPPLDSFGNVLNLDGTDDYVSIGNISALNFSGTKSFTFEALIKPKAYGGVILSKFNHGIKGTFVFRLLDDGKVRLGRNVAAPSVVDSLTSIPIGQYTHVAATYDGSTSRIFVNGIKENQVGIGSVPNTSVPVIIGANYVNNALDSFFNGTIRLAATPI